jgi:hypothetical protein
MKRWTTVLMVALLASLASASRLEAAQQSGDEQRALRERIEARYDVVPLSEGVVLRPKTRMRDVRFIEISDGGISINGDPVSGRELRERLGGDADSILRPRISRLTSGATSSGRERQFLNRSPMRLSKPRRRPRRPPSGDDPDTPAATASACSATSSWSATRRSRDRWSP